MAPARPSSPSAPKGEEDVIKYVENPLARATSPSSSSHRSPSHSGLPPPPTPSRQPFLSTHHHVLSAGGEDPSAPGSGAAAGGEEVWREEYKPIDKPFQVWLGRAKMMLFGHKKPRDPAAGGGGVADRKDFGWLILGGSTLCYIAGWVNAYCLMAAQATVSHVTGSTTKAGMAFTTGDMVYLEYAFGIWACFVLGGSISGVIIYHDTFALGRSYGHAFLLISFFLFWTSCWAVTYPDDHSYVFVASMAMGIQNGVTTRYSGNVVRTTHMTGLSTDIGITIGHVLRCHPKPDRWKLKMYIPMLVFFFFGAATSRAAYISIGRPSLFIPSSILFILGFGYIIFLARIRKQPFHKVLLHRVSNEIMTPHSPRRGHFPHLHLNMHLPHLPHLPHRPHHRRHSSQGGKGGGGEHVEERMEPGPSNKAEPLAASAV